MTAPRLRPAKFHSALKPALPESEAPDWEPEGATEEVAVTGAVGSMEAPATEVADS